MRNASEPVAQKFSTWVTGLWSIFSGRLSVSPDSPEPIVPNQNASTSSSLTPAERNDPKILNASRRKRIANGSGVTVAEVNQLVERFFEAKKMMGRMAGQFGMGGRSATKKQKNHRRKGKGKKGRNNKRRNPQRMNRQGLPGMPGMGNMPGMGGGMPSMKELKALQDQLPPGMEGIDVEKMFGGGKK